MQVEIDDKWVERVNSPMGFWACALAGVSVSFAPLGMYAAGKLGPGLGMPLAVLCMAVILFSGFFHLKLAQAVITEVYKGKKSNPESK
jgi:hypothetical protein